MPLTPQAQPGSAGPVLSSLFPIATVGPTSLTVLHPGVLTGGGAAGLAPPTISLTVPHSDQPDCLVYSLIPHKLVQFHSPVVQPHKSDNPLPATVC